MNDPFYHRFYYQCKCEELASLKYIGLETERKLETIKDTIGYLEQKADNMTAQDSSDLLQRAVCSNLSLAVELLLSNGVDPNGWFHDKSKNSILHEACYFADVEIVRLLLEFEANVNAKNDIDQTPLVYAWNLRLEKINHKNIKKIIKLLEKHCATT